MRSPEYIKKLIEDKVASPDCPILVGVSPSNRDNSEWVAGMFYMVTSTGHITQMRLDRAVETKDSDTILFLSCCNRRGLGTLVTFLLELKTYQSRF